MGCSSSKPTQSSLPPPVPRKDASNPIRAGSRTINGWCPWGGGVVPGPASFGQIKSPELLTQLCLYDHMYTYGLLTWAEYVRKVLSLTKNHAYIRPYFTPDAHKCWWRLEKGRKWATQSRNLRFSMGFLAFHGDPMYGPRCDYRHVVNVLMPMVGLNPRQLPNNFQYSAEPSALELAHAQF